MAACYRSHVYIFSLSISLSLDIWVVSMALLVWAVLLHAVACYVLMCRFNFPLNISPGVDPF